MTVTNDDSLLLHHPKRPVRPRDHDAVCGDETLREAKRATCFDHVRLDREPLPDLGAADEIDRHADSHQRIGAAHFMAAAVPHGFIGQRCNQPAMDETARVGMRRGQPKSEDNRVWRLLRIDRLPGIGEGARPGLALETFGNTGSGHHNARGVWCGTLSNANAMRIAPLTKFKTDSSLRRHHPRVIQYSEATVMVRGAAAYWM